MSQTDTPQDVVLYESQDGVAIITFNRPERLNAWTGLLGAAYFNALDRAAADSAVGAIVVTGAGRGFCAGADMDHLQSIGANTDAGAANNTNDSNNSDDSKNSNGSKNSDEPAAPQLRTDSTVPQLRTERHDYALSIPKPVIAAINGACAGLGFVHAMMCDVRFAAQWAKFTSSFARRGLIAEHGISWILPRLVGPSNALDILMSGRVFLAEEAKELGVVSKVFTPSELLKAAVTYARDLARYSAPWSMAQMKHQVWSQMDLDRRAALAESNSIMAESLKRPDFKEGVQSFLERRDPAFEPVTHA